LTSRKMLKIMKIILTLVVLLGIMMAVGCERSHTISRGSWSDAEIERMEIEEIESVPLLLVRY